MEKYQEQRMGNLNPVRFEIGDLAEARTFEKGFRGAWFRCKIKKVIKKKGRIAAYAVEYYDYTDESEDTITLYRFPSKTSSGHKPNNKELMMRPKFPSFYRQSELPDVNMYSQVIVAVADVNKVGDLVDWFHEGCFWSGSVTEVIDDHTVQIALLEPPRGEGSSYNVKCKDLRPSLDWSPELGWMVPTPLETQNGHLHARLIQPVMLAPPLNSLVGEMDDDKLNGKVTPGSSLEFNQSESSHTSASSLPHLSKSIHSKDSLQLTGDIPKQQADGLNAELDIGSSSIGKLSCSDSVSSTYNRDVSDKIPVAACVKEQDHENESSKQMRLNEAIALNSTACDDVESAILDLEELVNRVKWLKQILKDGIPSSSQGPTWEYMEHPIVSFPK